MAHDAASLVGSSFKRPDARQIATFFLGAVFFESLRCIAVSPFFRQFVARPGRLWSNSQSLSEKSTLHTAKSGRHVASLALDVLLPVSFCVAGLSYFSSLLAFAPTGVTGCSFVIALGGICQQLGRLVASMIILVDLNRVLHKFELFGSVLWLLLGAAAAFADNALSTGFLQPFEPLGVSFCMRQRMLPPAAVAFGLYLVIQSYFVVRVWSLFGRNQQAQTSIFTDAKVLRPLALILFEILAFVPSVAPVDAIGEFIPFSVGVLLVLAAFSAKSEIHRAEPQQDQIIDIVPRPWSQNPSPLPSRAPSWNPPAASRLGQDRGHLSLASPSYAQPVHPFAAGALRDRTLLRTDHSPLPDNRMSRFSAMTAATSTEEGVIQTVGNLHVSSPMRGTLVKTSISPQAKPWNSQRHIATPDQLNSFATQQQSLPVIPSPALMTGIPPPPLTRRAPPDTIRHSPSPYTASKAYGSDIIRMTSGSTYGRQDDTRRQTMDTMHTGSHLSYTSTEPSHEGYATRESYLSGHHTFGGGEASNRHPSMRQGSLYDGRRKSSLRSRRTTAASLGQLDFHSEVPVLPPLPSSIRPLPATPTYS